MIARGHVESIFFQGLEEPQTQGRPQTGGVYARRGLRLPRFHAVALSQLKRILREVYPERTAGILRFAQNDKRRAQRVAQTSVVEVCGSLRCTGSD